jgi:uncharacterized membrane protein
MSNSTDCEKTVIELNDLASPPPGSASDLTKTGSSKRLFTPTSSYSWADWFSYQSVVIAGSWWFVMFELTVILGWVIINSLGSEQYEFDPAPFTVLNLVISFLTEYIGTFEVIAQNATYAAEQVQAAHHKKVITQITKLIKLLNAGPSSDQLICEAVDEAMLIVEQGCNVQELLMLEQKDALELKNPDLLDASTCSDRITDFLGKYVRSWKYIGVVTLFFTVWTVINSEVDNPFDPFPYTYLNFFVSCWTLLQESFVIKVTFRRAQHDLKRNKELHLRSIQNLRILIQFHMASCVIRSS